MSQRQFAGVLFAVVGVFMTMNWLPQIVLAVGFFAQPMETSVGHQANSTYAITLLIGTLVAILLAITLVVMRERLAAGLFAADTGPLAARDTQAVALSVLGCYFAIGAIPRLAGVGLFGVGRIEWVAVIQLVLGVALFFGARGVARLWAAARSAGSSGSA